MKVFQISNQGHFEPIMDAAVEEDVTCLTVEQYHHKDERNTIRAMGFVFHTLIFIAGQSIMK